MDDIIQSAKRYGFSTSNLILPIVKERSRMLRDQVSLAKSNLDYKDSLLSALNEVIFGE